jgi:hypothetical protein
MRKRTVEILESSHWANLAVALRRWPQGREIDSIKLNNDKARKAAETLPRLQRRAPLKPRQVGQVSYLREAQAYMLISMPTGTSTIFGAFQAIWGLPSIERDIAPGKT